MSENKLETNENGLFETFHLEHNLIQFNYYQIN